VIDFKDLVRYVVQRSSYRALKLRFLEIKSPLHPVDLRNGNACDAYRAKQNNSADG
jgi:hypothetical protein